MQELKRADPSDQLQERHINDGDVHAEAEHDTDDEDRQALNESPPELSGHGCSEPVDPNRSGP